MLQNGIDINSFFVYVDTVIVAGSQETYMRIILCILLTASAICSPINDHHTSSILESSSFDGKIYAEGIYSLFGLIKVEGTLSFTDSLLYWSARGSMDSIPYQCRMIDDHLMFTATAVIENDETISWRGFYDGEKLEDVQAIWTRREGDSVHDFLLPDIVTLKFKSK